MLLARGDRKRLQQRRQENEIDEYPRREHEVVRDRALHQAFIGAADIIHFGPIHERHSLRQLRAKKAYPGAEILRLSEIGVEQLEIGAEGRDLRLAQRKRHENEE